MLDDLGGPGDLLIKLGQELVVGLEHLIFGLSVVIKLCIRQKSRYSTRTGLNKLILLKYVVITLRISLEIYWMDLLVLGKAFHLIWIDLKAFFLRSIIMFESIFQIFVELNQAGFCRSNITWLLASQL